MSENKAEEKVKNEKEEVKNEKIEETEIKKEEPKKDEDLKLAKELEELNDRYKRLFAEFENYKKRTQKESLNKYAEITGDVVSKKMA